MKWKKLYKESLGSNQKESPYIDIPKFREEIKDILKADVDELEYDENEPDELYLKYMKDAAPDFIDDYVDGIVEDTIKSFDKLVHRSNTSMVGNFADIRYDWDGYHKEYPHGVSFNEVIEMIDNGEDNEKTREFKTWTIDWYFNAFGTYNLKYNWNEFLEEIAADQMYQDERDRED